jgi:hypothetical protein
MNLWDKKAGLFLIGMALAIFSCEDPGTIGLELEPGNADFVADFFEFQIEAKQVQGEPFYVRKDALFLQFKDNEIVTDEDGNILYDTVGGGDVLGKVLMGEMEDPDLGKVSLTTYAQFVVDTSQYIRPDNGWVFDSTKLFLGVDYVTGTYFNSPQTFTLHELQDDVGENVKFNEALNFDETVIGRCEIGEDTIHAYYENSASIFTEFEVNESFAQKFYNELRSLDDSTFYFQDRFREFFKGFVIKPESTNGIFGINPRLNTRLVVYYHNESDTSQMNIFWSGSNYYHQIAYERSATELAGVNIDNLPTETVSPYLYGQSGTSMLPYFTLDNVIEAFDTIDAFVINRSELSLEIELPTDTTLWVSSSLFGYLEEGFGYDSLAHIFTGGTSGNVLRSNRQNLLFQMNRVQENDSTNFFRTTLDGVAQVDILTSILRGNIGSDILLVPSPGDFGTTVNSIKIKKESFHIKIYYSKLKN